LADARPIADDPVAGLIDIPTPREVSLWPQTWTARIAIILLLAALIAAAWHFIRHYRANRYRREALAELTRIARGPAAATSSKELATQLSLLLKRTALAAFPREQVASLSGAAWLGFLDRTSDATEFSRGVGQWLARASYSPEEPGADQLAALVELTRRWIGRHHV
jgi:GAF domain-containing protein